MFGKTPPIAMPKFYVALPLTDDAPGMIILEDLSGKAALAECRIKGLSLPQALEAVTEIARLHAWSLMTTFDWKTQTGKFEDRELLMRGLLGTLSKGFKKSKEDYLDVFGSIDLEKLAPVSSYDYFIATVTEHHDLMDDFLIHGDFYTNNMLFEKNKDGSVSDRLAAIIDFQTVLCGSPAYDLARLFAFSISHKIRRKHEKEILQRYYDEVKSIAGDKFKIDFDQLRRLYDRQFASNAIMMVASIPTLKSVMVKSEGEQKAKDEKEVVENVKANYDDGMAILGL